MINPKHNRPAQHQQPGHKSAPSGTKQPKKATGTKSGQEWYMLYVPLALIVLAFFMLYQQALNFELLDWDDWGYIKNNPDVRDFNIVKMFTSYYVGNYHPLTCLTWSFDYALWGLNGKGYHLTNMLFHATNIVLVYTFVKLLFEKRNLALFTAAVFAIHPMHVESVAWVAERKDVLYGFFFLLSLIAWLRYSRDGEKKHYVASLLFFLCSLMSKSAAVVLPLGLLLIDYFKGKKINSTDLALKIPFFLLSVIFGLVALKSQQTSMDYGFAPHFPWINRIFIAFYGITHYLVSFIFPFKQSPLHPYPVGETEVLPWYFYGSVITILLVVAMWFYFKKHRKLIAVTFGFFILNLLLVIQLLPVGRAVVADRYVYLPYLGLSMLLGYVVFNTTGKLKNMLIGIAALWLVIMGIQTYARLPVWKNSTSVFSDIIDKYPREESAWYNRGLVKYYQQDYKAAKSDFDTALTLKPDNVPALYNRSLVNMQFQDYKGVLDDLNKAIELNPEYIDARKNRGIAKAIFEDYQGALNDFSFVLAKFPDDTSTLFNRGLTWINLNEKGKACADFTRAARLGSLRASRFANETCTNK